jgi:hypothetical protein
MRTGNFGGNPSQPSVPHEPTPTYDKSRRYHPGTRSRAPPRHPTATDRAGARPLPERTRIAPPTRARENRERENPRRGRQNLGAIGETREQEPKLHANSKSIGWDSSCSPRGARRVGRGGLGKRRKKNGEEEEGRARTETPRFMTRHAASARISLNPKKKALAKFFLFEMALALGQL